jgi:DNA-binding NarL/FixJ family response regulator
MDKGSEQQSVNKEGPVAQRRILIVDDHPLLREGVAKWIDHEAELEVCGEAGDLPAALQAVKELEPDLVLCDVALAGRSGLELVKEVCSVRPEMPVVMLSMHDESIYALRALRAGARGYLMKDAGGSEVIAAIKQVLAGGTAFGPAVTRQLLEDFTGRQRGHRSPLAVLTDREFEILELLGQGKTNREIAGNLNLSPKTVETHRVNIRHKLHIKSTPELIRYAVRCSEQAGLRPEPESELEPAERTAQD